jgi:hypothetical protein
LGDPHSKVKTSIKVIPEEEASKINELAIGKRENL